MNKSKNPKAAKKAAPKKKEEFSLLADETQTALSSALESLSDRSKLATKFHAGDIQLLNILQLPLLYMQWFLGCLGLIVGRVVELFGPESVGKSSFLYWLFGIAMMQNSPCLYIETERKYTKERIKQFLHINVELAAKMLKSLTINQPTNVVEMAENIKVWVKKMREEVGVPMNIPLLVGVDTFSALQTKYEQGAAAVKEDDDDKKPGGKKKSQGAVRVTGDTKMGDHAKFAAAWMRGWPAYAEKYGVILVILGQQKDKIESSGFGGAPTFGPETSERYNKVKLGGRAFNFHSTHQILLLRRGMVRGTDGENIGDRIMMEVVKNCIGRQRRQLFFELLWLAYPKPGSEQQQCPIRWEETAVEWLASNRMFGIHPVGNKMYSSKELGVKEVPAKEVLLAVQMRPDLIDQVGKALRIYGYDNTEVPPCVAVAGGEVAPEDVEEGGDNGDAPTADPGTV